MTQLRDTSEIMLAGRSSVDVDGQRRTLGEQLSGKNNAFGFLRLFFASLVIVDHAFALGGFGGDPMSVWTKGQDTLGGIAVAGFFGISGYLITRSAMRTSVVPFLWHRVLRVFPAYWFCLVVSALVVGPVAWSLQKHSISSYWSWSAGGPAAYVFSNAKLEIGQWGIHDIFGDTPYGETSHISVFNGSLWTLAYEWRCYIIVGGLTAMGFIRHARFAVPVVWFALWALTVLQVEDASAPGRVNPWFADIFNVRLSMIFMTGSVLAIYAKSVPLNDWLGASAGCLWITSLFMSGYSIVGYPTMVYFVLWLATRLGGAFRRVGAVNDYSYGVYIYGFLVQQVLASASLQAFGFLPFVLVSLVASIACAAVSWHLIEKRFLELKHKGPGRGLVPMMSSLADWSRVLIAKN